MRYRHLVGRFRRVAYVAYTATPFANVLIDPAAVDRIAGQDLYPHHFIIDLPQPPGYYGVERIFGITEDGEEPNAPTSLARHVESCSAGGRSRDLLTSHQRQGHLRRPTFRPRGFDRPPAAARVLP